jgi:hypothetical protein
MCQYALYIYLTQKGYTKTKIHCYWKHLNEHNGLELSNIFANIILPENRKLIALYVEFYLLFDKIMTKMKDLFHVNISQYISWLMPYDAIIIPNWHTYLFPDEIKNSLLNHYFVFSDFNYDKNKQLSQIITGTNSVSIHIRRLDYMTDPKWRCSHGDICDATYYANAINYIKQYVVDPQFIVFSDTQNWAKNNLPIENAIYVDWNKGKDSFRDMQLMSLCKHNIIANSSFSWWGAWLNKNHNKIVIAPSKWLNIYDNVTYTLKFIYPEWICINNDHPNLSLIIKEKCSIREIQRILEQFYTDFEILMPPLDVESNDLRIKNIHTNKPNGIHVFSIEKNEIKLFKNKKYLREKLYKYFKSLTQ